MGFQNKRYEALNVETLGIVLHYQTIEMLFQLVQYFFYPRVLDQRLIRSSQQKVIDVQYVK